MCGGGMRSAGHAWACACGARPYWRAGAALTDWSLSPSSSSSSVEGASTASMPATAVIEAATRAAAAAASASPAGVPIPPKLLATPASAAPLLAAPSTTFAAGP